MWVCSQLHRSTDHFVNTFWLSSCQMLFSVGRIHRTGVWCNAWLAIKVVKMFEFRYVYIFSAQAWQKKKKKKAATEKVHYSEFFQPTTEWQLKSCISLLVGPITRTNLTYARMERIVICKCQFMEKIILMPFKP